VYSPPASKLEVLRAVRAKHYAKHANAEPDHPGLYIAPSTSPAAPGREGLPPVWGRVPVAYKVLRPVRFHSVAPTGRKPGRRKKSVFQKVAFPTPYAYNISESKAQLSLRTTTMKICPQCSKTYSDDSLNFCLEDGSVLTAAMGQPPPDTVLLNQPRMTTPGQPMQSAPQAAWSTAPQQYSMQPPKKSSKTWLWVLLILGALVLVCGGGFVGFLAWIGSQADKASNSGSSSPSPTPPANKVFTSGPASDRKNVENLDLSKWVQTDQSYGFTEFSNGGLTMASKKKDSYFVLTGLAAEMSVNADSQISVSNINNEDTTVGYGLVFHSLTKPLAQGYAFLVDAKKQRYRVVHHTPGKEEAVVPWTKSDAINDGTDANVLEVRDRTDTVDLYINGTKVNSIKNTYGAPNGVVGLYAGDGIKVVFRDFEIHK
jgi:hypothetical protein